MLEQAWDGDWYRRAYFDDGTPLGSAAERGGADRLRGADVGGPLGRRAERARRARDGLGARAPRAPRARRSSSSSRRRSTGRRSTPATSRATYRASARTAGSTRTRRQWVVLAMARLGHGDEAVELFHMLNPINHSRSRADVERYKTEPYVARRRRLRPPGAPRARRAGPGTRARPAGCTAWRSRESSGSQRRGSVLLDRSRASRPRGRPARSSGGSAGRATRSSSRTRSAAAAASRARARRRTGRPRRRSRSWTTAPSTACSSGSARRACPDPPISRRRAGATKSGSGKRR